MATIYVTRHGETEWNTLKRMQGHLDSPLTEMGCKQASWLGERLRTLELQYMYSSPSGRALQTASVINEHHGLPIVTVEAFKEIYLGEWEGKTQPEIEAMDAAEYDHFWHVPERYRSKSGESFEAVIERAGAALEQLAEAHPGGTVLVVAHAVVLKGLFAYILKKDIKDFWTGPFMHSTCLNCFEKTDEGWQITLAGDTSHYPEEVEAKWVHPQSRTLRG